MSRREEVRVIAGKLAGAFGQEYFSTGDRAELRRMRLRQTPPFSFWRLLDNAGKRFNDGSATVDEYELWRWQLVALGMAIMSPNHHNPKMPVGRVLQDINYSEQRLARLLKSRGVEFNAQYLRMVRQLAASNEAVDWRELAWFIFAQDISEKWAENCRLKIASNYYNEKKEK